MRLATVIALSLPSLAAVAAPPSLEVALSPDTCTVGDPVEITLTVATEPGQHVGDLRFGDLPEDIVLSHPLEPSLQETAADDQVRQVWRTSLVAFQTGDFELPEITAVWTGTDGASGEVTAALGLLSVESLLALGATPPLPEPPQGPFDLPAPRPRWPYHAAAAAAVAALLAWWIARRLARREGPVVARPKRVRPPHEVALEDLEALAAHDLTTDEELRLFFFTMSAIVRLYFEREFGIGAPEMTSSELLAAVREQSFPAPLCETMLRWVQASDLVKYASQIPREDHCRQAITLAKAIVADAHQHNLALREERTAQAA